MDDCRKWPPPCWRAGLVSLMLTLSGGCHEELALPPCIDEEGGGSGGGGAGGVGGSGGMGGMGGDADGGSLVVTPELTGCDDSQDGDGDGRFDEGPGVECDEGRRFVCVDGQLKCEVPTPEVSCGDGDSDDDGLIDEGLGRACQTECGAGTIVCSERGEVLCAPVTVGVVCGQEQMCSDGADEDGDGRIDEFDDGEPCEPDGLWRCVSGRLMCVPGGETSCNDGIDEDRDGIVDEGQGLPCTVCGLSGTLACDEDKGDFYCQPDDDSIPRIGDSCAFGARAERGEGVTDPGVVDCTTLVDGERVPVTGQWECDEAAGRLACVVRMGVDGAAPAPAGIRPGAACTFACAALGDGGQREGAWTCDPSTDHRLHCQPTDGAGLGDRVDASGRVLGEDGAAVAEPCGVDADCDGLVGFSPPCNGCAAVAATMNIPLDMVCVPPGTFTMGSPPEEIGRSPDREAQREVQVTRTLFVDVYEIDRIVWDAVAARSPEIPLVRGDALPFAACPVTDDGRTCPVVLVDWLEVTTWLNIRSDDEGLSPCYRCRTAPGDLSMLGCAAADLIAPDPGCDGYRLPTDAEWEYVARAATETRATYNGELGDGVEGMDFLPPIARYSGNSSAFWGSPCSVVDPNEKCAAHPVGELLPNRWGLHDILGNAFEWVGDTFTEAPGDVTGSVDPFVWIEGEASRTIRGGSWTSDARGVRFGRRGSLPVDRSGLDQGFRAVRVVMTAEPGGMER